MSRRMTPEGRRLAEDVARVINSRPADPRLIVDPREARKIRQAAIQERKERRQSSMPYLLRRQFVPWIVGVVVFAVGAVIWLMQWLSDDPFLPSLTVFGVSVVAVWVAFMVGRRHQKWRGTAYRAAVVASVWLVYAAHDGPSWETVLVWMVGVIVSSSSWWKAHRPGYPKAPAVPAVPETKHESVPALWDQHLGAKDAIMAGSFLSDPDDSKANCESYTINLRPGKQTITGTIRNLELIAGGLYTPVENLVLEPHPDRNPNHVKLTVVRKSPIKDTLPYAGARIVGSHRNMIEVGPYGDGDGWARWQMWRPGEKPMTGSWLSGLVVAGTGSGKSRLVELLAAGYMATGNAVVWFVDPQGGASSPALQEYADWYVSSEGVGRMIAALEDIAQAREDEMGLEGWSRFDPTPERPGIVVFLDECHVTIGRYGAKLEALARKVQKVGISFVALTQGGSLESLGKDTLRASLMANLIVMKTKSNQTKNLLPGLTVDPEMLPEIPGFGYTIGVNGARTAPFRSEYLAEPERWFKQYAKFMAKLDAYSANAAGNVYLLREAAAVEEHEAKRARVEQLRSGPVQPTLDEPDDEDVQDEPAQGGAFQVAAFPTSPAGRPQDVPSWQRILTLVGQGVTRTAEIQKAVGLSPSQTAAVLKQLLEDKHLEQPTRGVYAIAGSASPPER